MLAYGENVHQIVLDAQAEAVGQPDVAEEDNAEDNLDLDIIAPPNPEAASASGAASSSSGAAASSGAASSSGVGSREPDSSGGAASSSGGAAAEAAPGAAAEGPGAGDAVDAAAQQGNSRKQQDAAGRKKVSNAKNGAQNSLHGVIRMMADLSLKVYMSSKLLDQGASAWLRNSCPGAWGPGPGAPGPGPWGPGPGPGPRGGFLEGGPGEGS